MQDEMVNVQDEIESLKVAKGELEHAERYLHNTIYTGQCTVGIIQAILGIILWVIFTATGSIVMLFCLVVYAITFLTLLKFGEKMLEASRQDTGDIYELVNEVIESLEQHYDELDRTDARERRLWEGNPRYLH